MLRLNRSQISRFLAVLLAVVLAAVLPLQYYARSCTATIENVMQDTVDSAVRHIIQNGSLSLSDYNGIVEDVLGIEGGSSIDISIGQGGTDTDLVASVHEHDDGCRECAVCCGGYEVMDLVLRDGNAASLITALTGGGGSLVACSAETHVHTPECYEGHNHVASGCHLETETCRCGKPRTKLYKTEANGGHWESVYHSCPTTETRSRNCSRCSGTGTVVYGSIGWEECSVCEGEGGHYDSRGRWVACSYCGGAGEIYEDGREYHTCPSCSGSGTEYYSATCSRCGGDGYYYSDSYVTDYVYYYYCGDKSHGYGAYNTPCTAYVCGYTEAQHCRLPNDDNPICGPWILSVAAGSAFSYTDTSFVWSVAASGGEAPYSVCYDVCSATTDDVVVTGVSQDMEFDVTVPRQGEYYLAVYVSDARGKVSDLLTSDTFSVYAPPSINLCAPSFDNTSSSDEGYTDSLGRVVVTHQGGKGARRVQIVLAEEIPEFASAVSVSEGTEGSTVTELRDLTDMKEGSTWQVLGVFNDAAVNSGYAIASYSGWSPSANVAGRTVTVYDPCGNIVSITKTGAAVTEKPAGCLYRWSVRVTDEGGRSTAESFDFRIRPLPVMDLSLCGKGYVAAEQEVTVSFEPGPGFTGGEYSCSVSCGGVRTACTPVVSGDGLPTGFSFVPETPGEHEVSFVYDSGIGRSFTTAGSIRIYTPPSVEVTTGGYGYENVEYPLSVVWKDGITGADREIRTDWYFRESVYASWKLETSGSWTAFAQSGTYGKKFAKSGYYMARISVREKAEGSPAISNPAWAEEEAGYAEDMRYCDSVTVKEVCVAARCTSCGWYYLEDFSGWYDTQRVCPHCPCIYMSLAVTPSELHVESGTGLDLSGDMRLYLTEGQRSDAEGIILAVRTAARSFGLNNPVIYELVALDSDPAGWFTAETYDERKLGRQTETVYASSEYPMGRASGGGVISPAAYTDSYMDYVNCVYDNGARYVVSRAVTVDVEPRCSICGRVYHFVEDGCPYCTPDHISATIRPAGDGEERTFLKGVLGTITEFDVVSSIDVTVTFADGHTEPVSFGDVSAYPHAGKAVSGYTLRGGWDAPLEGLSEWDRNIVISLTRSNGAPGAQVPSVSPITREADVTKTCTVPIHLTSLFNCDICGEEYGPAPDGSDPGCPVCSHVPVSMDIVLRDDVCHRGEGILVLTPVITVTMRNGSSITVPVLDCECDFDTSELGVREYELRYTDAVSGLAVSDCFTVEVIDPLLDECPACGLRYDNRFYRLCPTCALTVAAVEVETHPSTLYLGMDLVISVLVRYRAGNAVYTGDYSVSGFDTHSPGLQHVTVIYHDSSSGRDFTTAFDVDVMMGEGGYVLCENGHWYKGDSCPYCEAGSGVLTHGVTREMMYTEDILAEFDRQLAEGVADPVIFLADGDTVTIRVGIGGATFLSRLSGIVFDTRPQRTVFSCGMMYNKREGT